MVIQVGRFRLARLTVQTQRGFIYYILCDYGSTSGYRFDLKCAFGGVSVKIDKDVL